MDTPITRAEHEAFAQLMTSENQRLRDEDTRQNKRIDLLEENVKEISALATSVNKLATNMESMVEIQKQQGTRLSTLEGRDGEMWRKVVGYIATAIIGIVLGFVFTQIGM
jgi:tetrahydromethanopterin S-methyltransferase subunit B